MKFLPPAEGIHMLLLQYCQKRAEDRNFAKISPDVQCAGTTTIPVFHPPHY